MHTTCGYCLRAAFILLRASGLCGYDSKGGNYSRVASDCKKYISFYFNKFYQFCVKLASEIFPLITCDHLWQTHEQLQMYDVYKIHSCRTAHTYMNRL